MEKKKAYALIARAITSYMMKYHPYLTVWMIVSIIAGIYEGMRIGSIQQVFYGIICAFLPSFLKGLFYGALGLIDPWEKHSHQMEKMRRRDVFIKYIDEYIDKMLKK